MPNLPLWVYCCCGGEPTDCCDWYSICSVPTPTSITISWTYEKVRYYSNGQRLVQEYETWTVANANAISRKGSSCTDPFGYDDGCTQATYTYESGQKYYAWNVLNDATLDGTTGTISGNGSNCSGCVFTGSGNVPTCDLPLVACLTRTDKVYGTTTLTGGTPAPFTCVFARSDSDILKYGCTTKCGCVAPFVQFRPTTASFTGSAQTIYGCCTDDTNTDPFPQTIMVPSFTLVGLCGCPNAKSWVNPKEGCDCPNTASPFAACQTTCDCNPVNHTIILSNGQDCYSWTCANYAPDPENPIIISCEPCIDFVEKCESKVTVTII